LQNVTLLGSGFETAVTDNFTTSVWTRTTGQYNSGSASALLVASSAAGSGLDSIAVDTSKCNKVYISVYSRDDDLDTGAAKDAWLYYKDSSSTWNQIQDMAGYTEDAWTLVELNTADASYLHSTFQIRFANVNALASTENWWIDDVKIICEKNAYTPVAGQNSTAVNYSAGGSDYQVVTAVKAIVTVDSYNPTASNTTFANNSRPDLQVGFYNGTAYGAYSNCNINASMGNNALNTTDWNCTISASDAATIAAWNTSANRKVQIRAINLDAYNNTIFDEINVSAVYLNVSGYNISAAEQNSTATEYSAGGSNYQTVTAVKSIITIDSYNPTASNTTYANNNRPDLQVGFYNGTAYGAYSNCNINASMGNNALNTTDWNCTISASDAATIAAWNTSANRKVQIRAINLDANNLIFDEINVSAVYLNVSGYNITAVAEQNSTEVEYTSIGGSNYQTVTAVKSIVTIDSYNPTASNTTYANNNRPDIQAAFYNGTAYGSYSSCNINASMGNNALNTTDWNCTISASDAVTIAAWNNSTNRKIKIKAINLDAYNNLIFDEINVSAVYLNVSGYNISAAEQNSTATEYSAGGSNYQTVTAVKSIITIDSYNPTASNTTFANNNRPDLQVGFYNGTAYGAYSNCSINASMGNNALNTTDWNCTISASDAATIAAWNSSANRKIQIRGINLDANNLIFDEINVSAVYLNVSGYNITSGTTEQNSAWVEYTGIGGSNYSAVTSVSAIITVDSYNPRASNTTYANNNRPDLEVGFYNGITYINGSYCSVNASMGNEVLNTTDWNCTITSTNSGILNAWKDNANRKIQIRGINLDAYNNTIFDEINVTSLFAEIDYSSGASDLWYLDFSNTVKVGIYTIPFIYANSTIGLITSNATTMQFEVFAITINISFIPPTPENNSWVNNNWVFVNTTLGRDATSCNLTWNGTVYAMSSYNSTTWYKNNTGISDGQYEYVVNCVGENEASGTSSLMTVKIGTTKPACSISGITENSDYSYVSGNTTYYNSAGNGSINVSVNATDDVGIAAVNFPQLSTINGYGNDTTALYSSQDVGAYNYTTSSTYSDNGTITCYDTAGNTNTTTFNLTRDITAPNTTVNSPASGAWERSNFSVNISDSDSQSGLQACYYRVISNGTETKGWTARNCNNATAVSVSVGAGLDCRNETANGCVIELKAYDNVNNSNFTSINYSIDWTPPSAPGNLTDNIEGWSFINNRTFNWTAATDNVSGISGYYYAIDDDTPETGGNWTTNLYYINTSMNSGNHTLYVKAADNAGNVGDYASHEFLIIYSKGIISTIPGATPFWTNVSNPLLKTNFSCLGDLQDQQQCNVSWTVNSTGETGNKYEFFVIFESLNYSQVPKNQTQFTYIEIRSNNTPPSKVNLTSPLNNSGTEHDRNMTFVWQNATDADGDRLTYFLEVSNSSSFAFQIISISTNLTNYTYGGQLNLSTAYFWRVRAFDSFEYGNWSDVWNFSIEPYRDIELYVSSVDFGTISPNTTNDTTDNNPQPIKIRNNGNIPVNISINGTALWNSVALDTSYYQFKIGNISTEYYSFDWRNSKTIWQNMSATSSIAIVDLGYLDSADEARIEINVTAPNAEPPGSKNSTIYVMAS